MSNWTRFVRLCLGHLRGRGVDPAPLLSRFDIPKEAETAEAIDVPVQRVADFADAAAELASDPDLGVHLAHSAPHGAYGVAEYLAITSPDLGTAWGVVARFAALLNTSGTRRLELTDAEMIFEVQVPGHPLGYGRQVNEFDCVRMLHVSRQQTGAPLIPRRIWFAHPRPSSTAALEAALGTKAQFGSGSCGIALERACADIPMRAADPALAQVLGAHAEVLQNRLEVQSDLLARVREQVKTGLQRGSGSLEAVAAAMHMSGRTLQRRLAERDVTFASLVEEVRKSEAARYLTSSRLTVTEIAFLLGYSEVSAFVRAFRAWTGQTPLDFRQASAP